MEPMRRHHRDDSLRRAQANGHTVSDARIIRAQIRDLREIEQGRQRWRKTWQKLRPW